MKRLTAHILIIITLCSILCVNVQAIDVNEFKSRSAVLIEAKTGKILFDKNKDEQLAMASITKLMILLITMEEIDAGKIKLDDMVVGSPKAKAAGGSTIFLDVGEKMSVDDILKGICISSANDAAIALSETIAGSEADFVNRMNERALQLGLVNTHYVNVTGFDADKHYSSTYDIALLSREIIVNHPKILEYSGIRETWLRGKRTQLLNTNKLLSMYQYATGLKTGTETNAKYCLSATAKKDDMELIAVILGAPDTSVRFSEAKKLLEYGYDNYELASPIEDNEAAGAIPVIKGAKEKVNTIVANPVSLVVPKTYSNKIKKEVVLDKNITAPVKAGTKVGEMTIIVAGETSQVLPVVAAEDVEKVTFWQSLWYFTKALFRF